MQKKLSEDFENIAVQRQDRVFTVTLDNEKRRNTLSRQTLGELQAAFAEIASSDALAVVIQANGPVFSSGHDFKDMAGVTHAEAESLLELCAAVMQKISSLPQVVVAKIDGFATAAGCQLVAACDMAVASLESGFAAPGGKGGLFCHTPMVAIAQNIGRKRAFELASTGDPISAETAASWGLINKAVPADQLDEAISDLVARSTRGSATSKALGKQTLYAQMDLPAAEAYRVATEVMAKGVVHPDGQEGITSFIEKRKPSYAPPQW